MGLEVHSKAKLEAARIGGAGDLAEVAGAQGGADAEPGEVVGCVIKLGAELHGELFAEAEVLLQRSIPVVGARATDDVAAEVAEGAHGREGEGALMNHWKRVPPFCCQSPTTSGRWLPRPVPARSAVMPRLSGRPVLRVVMPESCQPPKAFLYQSFTVSQNGRG